MRFLTEGNYSSVNIMMTITALSLFSITDFLDEVYSMKKYSKSKTHPVVSLNILRFPAFQNCLTLPESIRQKCRNELYLWYQKNKDLPYWLNFELSSIERLIEYLDTTESPHRKASGAEILWKDMKSFYTQYNERRNKTLDCFPNEFNEWFNSIEIENKQTILRSGDNTVYENDNDSKLIRIKNIL
jgi:hypothetical protein